ncbi:MAG: hypothetical protein JWQ63_3088 [Mucilaginibacter sp.]|nr:hypothetical protein [Mucilaginibacter sp.]
MKRIIILLTAVIFSFATQAKMVVNYRQTPATSQHLKKNGTPDKRYKSNKSTTTPASTGPLTKSGKPDMRYKANNPNAGNKKKQK